MSDTKMLLFANTNIFATKLSIEHIVHEEYLYGSYLLFCVRGTRWANFNNASFYPTIGNNKARIYTKFQTTIGV